MIDSFRAPGSLKVARVAAILLTCVIGLLLSEQPTGAIVGGAPTNVKRARNVGTLVVGGEGMPWLWAGCGVTLISPSVGVTAGHCIAFGYRLSPFTRIGVSFASEHVVGGTPLPADLQVHEGTDVLHPRFRPFFGGGLPLQDHNDPALADVGVIVFNRPVRGLLPAHLPDDNTLNTAFDGPFEAGVIGYGSTSLASPFDAGIRRFTTMAIDAVYPAVATLMPAPGDTCFGDSGGPVFKAKSRHAPPVVVEVHAIVVGPARAGQLCAGGTTIMRLDAPHVSSWLREMIAPY